MNNKRILMAGCGILKKEVRYLNHKNGWDLDFSFLDSALHCDFGQLADSLNTCLRKHRDREVIVLYGTCHPLMEHMLQDAGTFRTEGQNCVEQLLGKDLFTEELQKGAFFLMEDWARRWDYITSKSFPDCKLGVIREIFQTDRKYFLALRTPCSGDFTALAEQVAAEMDVPLKWMDVNLDHLTKVLQQAIDRKRSSK